MRFIVGLMALTLVLVSCEKKEDADNTGINIRDRDSHAMTAGSQSEDENDRMITQKIRQAIMADDSLSTNAKNIKIITVNGVVTLKGPVADGRERELISRKLNEVHGIKKIDNQLEVTR